MVKSLHTAPSEVVCIGAQAIAGESGFCFSCSLLTFIKTYGKKGIGSDLRSYPAECTEERIDVSLS